MRDPRSPRRRNRNSFVPLFVFSLIAPCILIAHSSSANTPPSLANPGNKTVNELSTLAFTVTATDPDNPPQTLTFSLDSGSLIGPRIDTVTGAFTYTAPCGSAGNYRVTLCVSDGDLSSCASIVITVVGGSPPEARPGGPYSGCVGDEIQFNGGGQAGSCRQISGYDWNFGDGTPHAFVQNPKHSYAAAGSYTVLLTVIDNGSPPASGSAATTATVTAKRQGTFDGNAPQLNLAGSNDLDIKFLAGTGWSLSDWDQIPSNATLTATGYSATIPATTATSAEITGTPSKGHVVFAVAAVKNLLQGFSSQQFVTKSFSLEIGLKNTVGCNKAVITFSVDVKNKP